MTCINESILPSTEEGFRSEKSDWFKDSEYTNIINIPNLNSIETPFLPSPVRDKLIDKVPIESLKLAIELNSFCIKDKIVLCLHNEIGLFSLLCASFGAKKVYALESNETFCSYFTEIIQENNFESIIEIIPSDSIKNITLPTKVDIIICQWMGIFLFQNSYIKEVIYARDKFLDKNEGIIIPDKATMYLSAIEDVKYKKNKFDFWDNVYGINMDCIKKESFSAPIISTIPSNKIISNPVPIYILDMYNLKEKNINFSNEYQMIINKDSCISGFVFWVDYKVSKMPNQITYTTGPYSEETNFKQVIFYFNKDFNVKKKQLIKGSICSRINEELDDMEGLDVKISMNLNNEGENIVQQFKLY